jgi:hypothetical protein
MLALDAAARKQTSSAFAYLMLPVAVTLTLA